MDQMLECWKMIEKHQSKPDDSTKDALRYLTWMSGDEAQARLDRKRAKHGITKEELEPVASEEPRRTMTEIMRGE